MNKNIYTPKTPILLYFLSFLLFFSVLLSVYIYQTKTATLITNNKKINFTILSGLPDLAISTEATFIRHRSMSDVFSIYKDDGSLREYFPSTFVYSHSHIINGNADAK